MNIDVRHGDCLDVLRTMPDNSVDAVITDPPYGLSNTKPAQVADVLKAWVTGDTETVPSVPRKGRKNCLSQIILRTQRDSDGEDSLARKDFVNVPITFSSPGFPMFRAVDFNDDSSFREIEVNDVSPEFTLDDELVNGFFSEFGKERQDVEFRLWALKGCPGCVGVCTCLTESSQGVGAVTVRLGYYALADAESATPVVALRVTEVSAVLSFDGRRRSFELSPASSASEGDGLVLIVSPKGVGAVAGAGGLATVFEPGLVGGVGGAADGACSADFVAHVDLLDRLVNPSLHPTGFMGKSWDGFVPPPAVWKECMRVLKPGGHMAVFAGARTQDLMGLSIRLAGFEIRDTLGWVYGSGFPKSMDISKAIDKRRDEDLEPQARVAKWLVDRMAEKGMTRKNISDHFNAANVAQQWTTYWIDGAVKPRVPKWDQWQELKRLLEFSDELDAEVWRLNGRKGTPGEAWEKREVIGMREVPQGHAFAGSTYGGDSSNKSVNVTSSHSDAAKRWDGWGTALKPAIEPIILARKPLDGTVAANVLAHGVGGLNIDACRVPGQAQPFGNGTARTSGIMGASNPRGGWAPVEGQGRFPANVLLDEHAAAEMDKQSGVLKDRGNKSESKSIYSGGGATAFPTGADFAFSHDTGGGASRFFPVFKYQAKAPKKERPVVEREDGTKIQHPTVKPVELMEWLVTLITPPGGIVLDPFAGSGTTLQAARNTAFNAIGIEREVDYVALINKRLGNDND